jgi:hypothetical protein
MPPAFNILHFGTTGATVTNAIQISQELIQMYRERGGSSEFWAEPFNALTNASFLIAAAFALELAIRRRALTTSTFTLISLAGVIGLGSFLFHTIPTPLTKWLDIIPITLFQVLFTWLISCRLLSNNRWVSAGVVIAVVGSSFALMPFHQPINGSLFYMPSLVAMLAFGGLWARQVSEEPFLLMGAACCFALAITARSADWVVPWQFGSHFLWHLLNGIVVYMALRTWIIATTLKSS